MIIANINFEWDNNKAISNRKKHDGVTFEEASSVFEDDKAIIFDDPDHSDIENRFLIIGISMHQRLLIVCHCYRHQNDVIRIISARKATKSEIQQYTELNKGWYRL